MTVNESKNITPNLYLEFLKFGRERGFEGATEKELLELAKKLGYFTADEIQGVDSLTQPPDTEKDPKMLEKRHALERLVFESFVYFSDKKRTLTYDSYFKLLEHEELELARENAQSARLFSIGAIIIALISLLVAAYQVGKPITLADTQYQGLINTEPLDSITKRIEVLNEKLDVLRETTNAVESRSTKPTRQTDTATLPQMEK